MMENPVHHVYPAGDPNVDGGALFEQYIEQAEVGDLRAEVKALVEENEKLIAKCRNQRTELRRLNRRLQAMWEGVRFSHKVRADQLMTQVAKRLAHMELSGRPAFDIGKLNSITVIDGPRDLDYVDQLEKESKP